MVMNTKPIVFVDNPAGDLINERLMFVEVTDEPGFSSDSVRIVLDVTGTTEQPTKGSILRVELGWQGGEQFDVGQFKITNIKPQIFSNELEIIEVTSADFSIDDNDGKSRRSETYERQTIFQIVSKVAGRLKLSPRVQEVFQKKTLEHIDQKNESDLAFIQRLAFQYDAIAKPVDGLLVFCERGQLNTITGKQFGEVELILPERNTAPFNSLLSCDVESPDREIFNGAKADYFNQDTAEIVRLSTGSPPFNQLTGRFGNAQLALDAMKAEMKRMKRDGAKCTYSCLGNPLIMSESPVTISGTGNPIVDGQWSNDKVTHTFDKSSGFITSASASALL